jgi:hypothetical protein
MPDIGQQVRAGSTGVVEVGCKWHKKNKNCGVENHGARNRVGIHQRNDANVDIQSGWRNDVVIDQRNQADVDINSGQNSQNDVYIYQYNKANVHIR